MTLKLTSLKIAGFRPYGRIEQTLLMSNLAAIWGPNSKGKTSLGEAFEFLLTGSISRRELMASSQDEFAGALRNAHLADEDQAYVEVACKSADGSEHIVRRTLIEDYGKRQECVSRLEIDGSPADEQKLLSIGIVLSQPPLRAPVLAQHTLGHIFSVRPQDRATYFKSLFDLTDMDVAKRQVESMLDDLSPSDSVLLSKFMSCARIEGAAPLSTSYAASAEVLRRRLDDFADAMLRDNGDVELHTSRERFAAITETLESARSKTFPVKAFELKPG